MPPKAPKDEPPEAPKPRQRRAAAAAAAAAAPEPGPSAAGKGGRFFSGLLRSPDGARLEFQVEGVDLGIVNALRRALMADVPTAAFRFEPLSPSTNGVLVKANTSTLHNEIVGQRIGLVPINFDPNELRVFDPAQWRFSLRVKNTGNTVRAVTTKDFEVFDQNGARVPPNVAAQLFPPSPVTGDHVLLLVLKPGTHGDGQGEELHAECTASMGTGRQHSRWSPVSLCFFRNRGDPAASKAALEAQVAEARAAGATDGEAEALRRDWATLGAHRHFLRDEHGEPSAFDFVLETEAPRLTPEFLVYKALRVLHDRVGAVAADLRRGEDGVGGVSPVAEQLQASVQQVPYVDDFYEVALRGEDHTVGNLLQSLLYKRWVRDGAGSDVSFIGYHQPHPLEDRIVFKLKCAKPNDDPRARMAEGALFVQSELLAICLEWIRVSGLEAAGIVEVNELVRTRGPGSAAARLKGV